LKFISVAWSSLLLFTIAITPCRADDAAREQLHAVLWMQMATEYRANAVQAYQAATAALRPLRSGTSTALVEPRPDPPATQQPAIVMDIDETVLDNSPYLAARVHDHKAFEPSSWQRWVLSASAQTIPGAQGFITRARQLGYAVVFVSNRNCEVAAGYDAQGLAKSCPQKRATLDNLATVLGYRPADTDMLLRGERSGRNDADKRARRQEVAQRHRIAMLVGDDLNDFVLRADYRPEQHGGHWGRDWFVLANAIYGSWTGDRSIEQKYSALRTWVEQQSAAPADAAAR
jgi:acid phosphatase